MSDLDDFVSRVFYTAAKHGIVTGFADGTARPYAPATELETLAILLRAAGAVPEDYNGDYFSLNSLRPEDWYGRYVSFALDNGLLRDTVLWDIAPESVILRSDLTALLVDIMKHNSNSDIRNYSDLVATIIEE
jgi:hypothetical protein